MFLKRFSNDVTTFRLRCSNVWATLKQGCDNVFNALHGSRTKVMKT